MKRRLPEPETIALPPQQRYQLGAHKVLVDIAGRAERILARCYEAPGSVPHGYYATGGFIARCRRGHAYSLLYRCICRKMEAKAVRRGLLVLAERDKARETPKDRELYR